MKVRCWLALALLLWVGDSGAQLRSAASVEELLHQLRAARSEAAIANGERERRFLAEKESQARRMAQAQATLAAEEQRSEALHGRFDTNRGRLAELESALDEQSGQLVELFAITRQASGEAKALFDDSLISTQIRGRAERLAERNRRKGVPTLAELEELWLLLQEELTESGRVVRYLGEVIGVDGHARQETVTRIGPFNAIAEGRFLGYVPETGELVELARQPAARYRRLAAELERASEGMRPMMIDPSRGAVLSVLGKAPDLLERIEQGRIVGYLIIAVALIGLGIALQRLLYLVVVGRSMRRQLGCDVPIDENPLARVLAIYRENREVDIETLELKIEQSILEHLPQFQRGLQAIRVLAVIAPFLGLLGTVTGLIETFQSITLFGTGDPRLMAGGISQALVTTVLGLTAAIPLILLHSVLAGKSRRLMELLEQQSAGLIAGHGERHEAHAAAA